jgi:hypothetical protein
MTPQYAIGALADHLRLQIMRRVVLIQLHQRNIAVFAELAHAPRVRGGASHYDPHCTVLR